MTHPADMPESIREMLRRELKQDAVVFHKLQGGRNSQVFRVDCRDGSRFAVKAYFQSAQDQRDRMGNEFRALRFLKEHGLAGVAAPLAADTTRRIAIYEFVAGNALRPEEIGSAEIDQAVAFLQSLKSLADSGKAAHFSPASEACFSINAILQNLDDRFRRLDQAAPAHRALTQFLRDELAPARLRAGERCRAVCRDAGILLDRDIPMPERTLSPSDFGFHNALRRADGRLVFLDFEYFGWDDPAKTVSDFLLHPAMQLPPALKRRFLSTMLTEFAAAPALLDRVRAVYPLFILKWCAILLNEFTLEDRPRRCFADGAQGAWNETAQLEKARRMLAHLKNDDRDFLEHA